mmetsp:Transcript_24027/g.60558  ORF Transcript_24027/g.60558 Transcript_24027/m.60558 type:complete len:328 (-) Transcript_24027:487-1470(-)
MWVRGQGRRCRALSSSRAKFDDVALLSPPTPAAAAEREAPPLPTTPGGPMIVGIRDPPACVSIAKAGRNCAITAASCAIQPSSSFDTLQWKSRHSGRLQYLLYSRWRSNVCAFPLHTSCIFLTTGCVQIVPAHWWNKVKTTSTSPYSTSAVTAASAFPTSGSRKPAAACSGGIPWLPSASKTSAAKARTLSKKYWTMSRSLSSCGTSGVTSVLGSASPRRPRARLSPEVASGKTIPRSSAAARFCWRRTREGQTRARQSALNDTVTWVPVGVQGTPQTKRCACGVPETSSHGPNTSARSPFHSGRLFRLHKITESPRQKTVGPCPCS